MSETRIYSFRIDAGGTFPLEVQGENFLIRSSSGPVSVRWQRGYLANLLAGQGQDVPEGFARLDLSNTGSIAVYGDIIISDENFKDKRITGDVSVIDGEKARTLGGGGFMGHVTCGVALQYPAVQLFNNSTTNNLIVTGLSASLDVAGSIYLFGSGTILAVGAATPANALIGSAAASSALLRSEGFAVWPPNPYNILKSFTIGAASPEEIRLSRPIVVPPAFGLNVIGAPVSANLSGNFEWFEEAAV